jgi:hypothetical protein
VSATGMAPAIKTITRARTDRSIIFFLRPTTFGGFGFAFPSGKEEGARITGSGRG